MSHRLGVAALIVSTMKPFSMDEYVKRHWALRSKHLAKARAEFPVWLMSNAKWRKLFTWLFERRDLMTGYKIKLLLDKDADLWETRVLRPSDLEGTHLADNDLYPVGYDEIEWVEVITCHRKELRRDLAKLAKLEVRDSDLGLRIYGYSGK
jgi:hypothetical protein